MHTASGNDPSNLPWAAATPGTRLTGPWLVAARAGWGLLYVWLLAQLIVSLPGYRASILHPAADNAVLSPQAAEALRHIGITLDAYAWASLGILCVSALVSAAIALVLFVRRSGDWMALLISLFLLFYVIGNVAATSAAADTGGTLDVQALNAALAVPINAIFYAPFLLFPTGRFVPRWSWTLLIAWTAWMVAFTSIPPPAGDVLAIGYPFFFGSAIACQIYRYRRASTMVQRQQTKWVVFGLVVTLVVNQIFWLPSGFTSLGRTLYAPLVFLLYQLALLLVPVTFFIAMQRYHLFDIDVIIRRALVYGTLTALLGAIYAGVVLAAQLAGHALTGRPSVPAWLIVATTLLVAALFNPMRRYVQATIDRRFYRGRYDAAQTVKAFSATLRAELELEELSERLQEMVHETMRPAHVSLWLSPRAQDSGTNRPLGTEAACGTASAPTR